MTLSFSVSEAIFSVKFLFFVPQVLFLGEFVVYFTGPSPDTCFSGYVYLVATACD